jgi:hypothetical protein
MSFPILLIFWIISLFPKSFASQTFVRQRQYWLWRNIGWHFTDQNHKNFGIKQYSSKSKSRDCPYPSAHGLSLSNDDGYLRIKIVKSERW